MAVSSRVGSVYDYILERDRDKHESEQTRFKLKVLSARDLADALKIVQPLASQKFEKVDAYKLMEATSRALAMGFDGAENYPSPDGEDVVFDRDESGRITPLSIGENIAFGDQQELVGVMIANQYLTEDDLKNLPSPRR